MRRVWAFFADVNRIDAMLGWHVGTFVGDNNLNAAIVRKFVRAPTLLLALQGFTRMVRAEASHLQIGIQEREADVLFFSHYPIMKGVAGYNSSQGYQLGIYRDLIRHFTGDSWVPPEVGIEAPVVPAVAKETFPGSRILPRQRCGYLTIPKECLCLAAEPQPLLAEGKVHVPDGYVGTLSALLKPYLQEGYPDTVLASSLMDTSVRTMFRRLADSGLSYRKLVDQVRFSEAKRILAEPQAKMIDVAAAVGFDDAAHFSRMFRRIAGVSPREFRRIQES